ncbi:VanZ family protein [Haloarcula litorea]|uniref:VanZ family protein n=1 Tax=Haloarcula litorea TaxID=3032579 RepID=UPI0023E7BE79|nr:VanZ family protein [Halomicroarcula sp. GDY20]
MRRQVPAVALAVLLLVGSLVPLPTGGGDALPLVLGVALDKWVHALGYAALAGLASWGRDARSALALAAVLVAVAGYGAGIELLQGPVPTRDTSALDALANAVGTLAGGLAWLAVDRSNRR